jgi:hypothetical protein
MGRNNLCHFIGAVFLALSIPTATAAQRRPLALHPDNPHYFVWRGHPIVLIGSGEHYGAVLNVDFDYATYLKELEVLKLNLTRTFPGAYVEPPTAFKIAGNTLAPAPNRFICPWARSTQPGYANGGNKFDLTKWDEVYLKRLKDFMTQASRRGVVVELNFFTPFYEEDIWALSPLNAVNNINGLGNVARTNVYTLDRNGGLLAVQQAMVRMLVTELNTFDNLYYELCNEPYFGGVMLDWQSHIADVVVETEKRLPNKHLISWNVANGSKRVVNPHPAISIFNFHYASPPTAVALNYDLNKAIGLNETGYKSGGNSAYRMEAWEFVLAGGGLYNNLDFSFAVGHERGDFVYPNDQPGGGNTEFRRQLLVLRDFINSFKFVRMKPDASFIKSVLPEKTHAYCLVESGKQYAAYFFGGTSPAPKNFAVTLSLPKGSYRFEWIDVLIGKATKAEHIKSTGEVTLISPDSGGEIALRILR